MQGALYGWADVLLQHASVTWNVLQGLKEGYGFHARWAHPLPPLGTDGVLKLALVTPRGQQHPPPLLGPGRADHVELLVDQVGHLTQGKL